MSLSRERTHTREPGDYIVGSAFHRSVARSAELPRLRNAEISVRSGTQAPCRTITRAAFAASTGPDQTWVAFSRLARTTMLLSSYWFRQFSTYGLAPTRTRAYATRVARLGSCSSTIELHPQSVRDSTAYVGWCAIAAGGEGSGGVQVEFTALAGDWRRVRGPLRILHERSMGFSRDLDEGLSCALCIRSAR